MTDWELLSNYRAGSEPAFAELVGRHVDWVYSAALRRVRDPHTAADVTQATFIALAQAGKFREGAVMSAWLFQVMRFASSKALRSESRRKHHETAAGQLPRAAVDEPEWNDLAPLLEDAVANLGRKDRSAVLLRFYERKSFADVGGTLGISEEGARKRVARAVEKLRNYFTGKGYPAATAALTTTLASHTVESAPAHLAALMTAQPAIDLARGALHTLRGIRFLRITTIVFGASLLAATLAICVALPASRHTDAEPATQPTKITFDEVLAGIQKAETSFSNLYIKGFRTTIDEKAAGEKEWKATPMLFTGSAWYDANAQGRARINFKQNVMLMSGGRVSPVIRQLEDTWDGTTGCEIDGTSLTPGKPPRDFAARFVHDRQTLFDNGYSRFETGAAYTLQYWVGNREMSTTPVIESFSARFLRAKQFKEFPDMCEQRINGFSTVRAQWKDWQGLPADKFWFAPACGFALVRHEWNLNDGKQSATETLDVTKLKEVAPGVWFPLEAAMVRRKGGQPGAYERYNFTAADAVANDPKFDPAIFQPNLPPGYPRGGTTKP